MAKIKLDFDDEDLRSRLMSVAGVLKAGLTDAITEAFDPERLRKVKDDIVNITTQAARASDKVLENNIKLRQGTASLRDITNQITAATLRQSNYKAGLRKLESDTVRFSKEVVAAYKEAYKELAKQTTELQKQENKMKEIDQRVGALGAAFKGLSKIPFFGQLINADKALAAMNAKAYETGNRFKIMGAGLKEVSGEIATGALMKLLSVAKDNFLGIDKATGNLARSLDMTYGNAAKVADIYGSIARNSGDVALTTKKMLDSQVEMNDALGSATQFSTQRVKDYTRLRELGKLDLETLQNLTKVATLNGTTEEKLYKLRRGTIDVFKATTGKAIDQRLVMKDLTNLSNSIRINFIGSEGALTKAAANARAMGTNLESIDKVAGSLLNFENSIRSQMEAELISGRELNLERARYYALTNNSLGLQQEIQRLNITAETFGKKNRLDQEATAEALGMSREEMSKMLLDQQVLTNLGAKSTYELQARYNELRKTKSLEEASRMLGDEALARQYEQMSLQERTLQATDKLADSFGGISTALQPIGLFFTKLLQTISTVKSVLQTIVSITGALAGSKIMSFFSSAGESTAGALGTKTGAQVISTAGKNAGTQLYGAAASSALNAGTAEVVGSAGSSGAGSMLGNISKGVLRKVLSFPVISGLVEGIFANSDIKAMIADPNVPKQILSQSVGKRVMEGMGSVGGGIAGAAAVNLLNLVGIPGFLATTLAGTLGAGAGSWAMGAIADKLGASAIGDTALELYSGEMKEAKKLATGGLVTKGGLAQVDTGEVYLGKNSLETMKLLVEEMKAVKQAILSTGNTTLMVDGQKIATVVGKNVASSYGNLLNPGTTYS
jgi:hypothetical protein